MSHLTCDQRMSGKPGKEGLWKTESIDAVYPNSEKRHAGSSGAQTDVTELFSQPPVLTADLAKVYQQIGHILNKATWLLWQYVLLWP